MGESLHHWCRLFELWRHCFSNLNYLMATGSTEQDNSCQCSSCRWMTVPSAWHSSSHLYFRCSLHHGKVWGLVQTTTLVCCCLLCNYCLGLLDSFVVDRVSWVFPVLYVTQVENISATGPDGYRHPVLLLTPLCVVNVIRADQAIRRMVQEGWFLYVGLFKFDSCTDVLPANDYLCLVIVGYYCKVCVSMRASLCSRLFDIQNSSKTKLASPHCSRRSAAFRTFGARPVVETRFTTW